MRPNAQPFPESQFAQPAYRWLLVVELLANTVRGAVAGAIMGVFWTLLAVLLVGAISGLILLGPLGLLAGRFYAVLCWGIGAAGWAALGGALGGGVGALTGQLIVVLGERGQLGKTCGAVAGAAVG